MTPTSRRPPSEAVPAALEQRGARAELLAAGSESARAPLTFAAGLYRAQAALARAIGGRALTGALARDLDELADGLRALLRFASAAAPDELAQAARERAGEARELFRARLQTFWAGESDAAADYLSRALLKPYLEVLARLRIEPDRPRPEGACGFCGGRPWIAVRRAASEADGAARFLACSLCAGEWPLGRILCPVCAESDPAKLPSFQSESHPAARIEACESCRCYVKSIDLTVDARLIPEVDDLASLSLDLWAVEQGFTRIEPGLAGV